MKFFNKAIRYTLGAANSRNLNNLLFQIKFSSNVV